MGAATAFQHPDAKIHDYPILYAGLGVPATNDQTKAILLAEDFKVVDGKAVPEEKTHKLGMFVAASITKVENGVASFHLNVSNKVIFGFDEYTVADGVEVKMPFFEGQAIDTNLTCPLGSWVVVGGQVDSQNGEPATSEVFCIRILPPQSAK